MVTREPIASACICCASTNLNRSPAVLMPFVAYRAFGHQPVEITGDWGLRDLRQGMAYSLCNSLQCQDCGVLFLDYRFTDQQMAALYQNYRDATYNAQRIHFEPGYANVAAHYQQRADYITEVEAWLERYLPPEPRVLDWGGDTGINSPFLGRAAPLHVYDISGVDVLPGATRIGAEHLKRQHYDLVVCSEVLEHVPFPFEFLQQLSPVLDSDTLLYLEVPHEALIREHPDNRQLAPLKRHWHEHINFYTEDAVRCMLKRLGLEVVECLHLPVDIGWTKSEVLGVLAKLSRRE